MEIKGKGKPIFCGKDEKWNDELEKRLPTDDEIVVLALGHVKFDVLRCARGSFIKHLRVERERN